MKEELQQMLVKRTSELLIEIKKELHDVIAKSGESMNYPHFFILHTLFYKEKCMVSELGNVMGLTSGAITTSINKLEEMDYIVRDRDQKDRRVVWVSLTNAGKESIQNIIDERNKVWNEHFLKLTEDEQKQLLVLVNKMSNQ